MWELSIEGTVVDVIFPNHYPDQQEGFYSRMGNHESSNRIFRQFYELKSVENGFYDLVEWGITRDLHLVRTPILIPVSLAYIVKRGTLLEYTAPLTYYYNRAYMSNKDTYYNEVLAKAIELSSGEVVYADFIGRHTEDYYNGHKIVYDDFKVYVGEGTISVEQLMKESEQ